MRRINTPKNRKSPKTYPTQGLATIEQAATFLNCSRATVYNMMKAGNLRTVPLLVDKRIACHDLWAYIGLPGGSEQLSRQQIDQFIGEVFAAVKRLTGLRQKAEGKGRAGGRD